MGNDIEPRKPIDSRKIEITCQMIHGHLQLKRDRKIAELIKGEQALVKKIRERPQTSYMEIKTDLIPIINTFKYIKACKIVLRYVKIL